MNEPLPPLPPRDPTGHKGTFGTVAVFGGSCFRGERMFGAPALSALGALRAGCGLARLAVPGPLLDSAILLTPSATGVALPVDGEGGLIAHESARIFDAAGDAEAVVIGPGLGSCDGARALVLRALGQAETPVVADADALNLLSTTPDFHLDLKAPAVLTPHPGEFARLARTLRLSGDVTDPGFRSTAAERLAQRLGCVVVLKGAGTVVSDGLRTWTCGRGHPCLGTAGTGDVLAGVIAGLIAQFVQRGPVAIGGVPLPRTPERPLDLFDAARLGVDAHAQAGESWAARRAADAGMLAAELAEEIPGVLASMRGQRRT